MLLSLHFWNDTKCYQVPYRCSLCCKKGPTPVSSPLAERPGEVSWGKSNKPSKLNVTCYLDVGFKISVFVFLLGVVSVSIKICLCLSLVFHLCWVSFSVDMPMWHHRWALRCFSGWSWEAILRNGQVQGTSDDIWRILNINIQGY